MTTSSASQVAALASAAPWRRKLCATGVQDSPSAEKQTPSDTSIIATWDDEDWHPIVSATRTSDPMVLNLEDCESLRLPPGLEFPPGLEDAGCIGNWLARSSIGKDFQLLLETGSPAKVLASTSDSIESDDTSVGSAADCGSSQSGSLSQESMMLEDPIQLSSSPRVSCAGASDMSSAGDATPSAMSSQELTLEELVGSDASTLKRSSPSFVPSMGRPGDLAKPGAVPLVLAKALPIGLVSGSTNLPSVRTKLSSKAGSFVPSGAVLPPSAASLPLPFMPSHMVW